MRFLFINQYGPPDPSPTARLLGELADFLRRGGHEVAVVCQRQDYHGRPARGVRRMGRELRALASLAWAGLQVGQPAPDVVLALSSPPGVLVVAALLARWHRARLAHWAMDLYPELAVALGEVPAGLISRSVRAAMGWAYRRAALVVALDEDMRTHLRETYGINAEVLAPWPPAQAAVQIDAAHPGPVPPPWTWLYSGNLGRAHEWKTLLDAQQVLEKRGLPVHLLFQGDGAAVPEARTYADQLGLQQCRWKGYATEDGLIASFLAAGAVVVTQRPVTRGLLWPSKLAALVHLPRPILWVGPANGGIARHLTEGGRAGIFAPGQAEAVADWIEEIHRHPPVLPVSAGAQATIQAGCAALQQWLTAAK